MLSPCPVVDRELEPLVPEAPLTVSSDVTEREWDAYIDRRPDSSGYHLWRWRRVFEHAFGHRCEYLAARGPAGIAGVLPLVRFDHRLFGRFMVSLPFVNYGGVVADDERAARLLLESARRHAERGGLAHVELRHLAARFPELPARRHKVTMLLSLPSDVARAWERLDRKVRNQVRKAEKEGLTVTSGGAELLGEFYGVFAENMRDLGTPVYGRGFFDAVLEQFPGAARVFVVRRGRTPVAAGVTYAFRDRVEVPWASSLRAYRAMCPNNLLYWRIIESAIAEGRRVLDFGRSTPGEGTFLFKQQWGAQPLPLCWEYSLLARRDLPDRSRTNPRVQAAIAIWKRLPVRLTTLAGPRIVRFIP